MQASRQQPFKHCSLPLLFLWLLLFPPASGLQAEPLETPLRVDIWKLAPCVMEGNNGYTGFDIELWQQIAEELDLDYRYRETDLSGISTTP